MLMRQFKGCCTSFKVFADLTVFDDDVLEYYHLKDNEEITEEMLYEVARNKLETRFKELCFDIEKRRW